MFTPREVPKHQRMLENELERTISTMKLSPINSEEYAKTLTIVERLHEMMDEDKPDSVSKNTWVAVGANLLGILMIIRHENVNVITTKALGFIPRVR